jgi:SAM-dependent methyltransferase
VDSPTTRFYADYAQRLTAHPEASRSAMLPMVERCLHPGDVVLDVGAGAGRDMAAMQWAGLEVFGLEPSAEMRAVALSRHPGLVGRLRQASLPALGRPFEDLQPDGFDAVVCSAVLMHLAPDALVAALSAMAALLKRPGAGSQLLLSIPDMSRALLREDRDPDGRLFYNHPPDTIIACLQPLQLALRVHEVSDAVLQTAGTRWHTLVFG